MMDNFVATSEFGILVAQRVEGVWIARDDARDPEFRERRDQRPGELLEQDLVAGAAHAFARRGLACAEDRELHACRFEDAREGGGDPLAARVEGLRGPD